MSRSDGDGVSTVAVPATREMVDAALRAAVETLPESMRQLAGYHLGYWDGDGRPGAGGGKALRPALTLLAAGAVGGAPAAAVPAAVAVELVHNFSLVHDDVMDGDHTRRHRPTVWSVFGIGAAILAGDALLTLAFDVLARSGHPATRAGIGALQAAVQDLLDGQSADLAFEERADVGLAECVGMAERKTGALLGCACAIGAVFGGGTGPQVEHLRGFGERIGLAFQIVDDLLGIWGDPAATGKPARSDLQHRKKSLPVVAALVSGTPAGSELAALYHRDQPLAESDLHRVAELVDAAGGRAWCRRRVADLRAAALDHLRAAGPLPGAAAELHALAHQLTQRSA
ncbi:family 2 encapsulin nanocompartment cargo protein polyprenyl transferase [Actinomycetes bacterium KLBMP 9797]